ncbi:blastula protease 10-like [Acanthaster planci]|uniref:Metalloendopeptidase n=1 Tax=Acanthaster planci TaxID=133434 RepID=A0A8B8A0X2_ACAPL|nr:blastula protease 10-like [Acanthaster planci]
MEVAMILLLLVGSALAGTDQGARDEFTGLAVDFFMGKDKLASHLEMTPSEDCVEGDMQMNEEQKQAYYMMREVTAKNRARVRRAATKAFRLWPDNTFVYKFDPRLSSAMRAKFMQAVETYKATTCIQFHEAKEGYSGSIPPLTVYGTGNGCFSTVGGPGGKINLQEGRCNHLGVCLHEIGHALGAYHEHTRPDRREHVSIKEENIRNGYEGNFKVVDRLLVGIYDLQSAMHYACDAFSKDGRSETIVPHDELMKEKMGLQRKLSRLDIYKFNKMYSCYESCPDDLETACKHGGVPSKDCTCLCPDEYTGIYCETFKKTTECSAEYKDTSGIIRSPGFTRGSRYPSNTECVYAIECPEGTKVHLTFRSFDIEGWGCFFDTFETKTGPAVEEVYPNLYCDKALRGKTLTSKENLALLKFNSDSYYNYPGYELEYVCE